MKTEKIYCGGKFISTPQILEVKNPFDGSVVAQTFLASADDLEEAILAAGKAEEQLAALPSYKKFEALRFISDKIRQNRTSLAEILCLESGKPIRYALVEIDRAAQTFLNAAEECKRLPKEYISLDWTPTGENKEGIVKYFPVGKVAGISPFNFPINLAVHKIAPAIAAGCPIILKPASSTPLSTLQLAKIIDQTSLPKGAVSVLPMDRKTGNHLVTDERFSLLTFTGSPVVGWEMKKNAGKKKVVLELGGNAGVIVSEVSGNAKGSETMESVIAKCIVSAFSYSGQICIRAQRIYVRENLFDAFLNSFLEKTAQLKTGNPLEAATDISVMIDEENSKRVESWVEEARQAGAKILAGGKRSGTFYEPTVLTNTTVDMKVNCEEIFGPVICIEPFSTIEDAVRQVNDSRFGLQCGLFTGDIHEMDYCFNRLKVGGVILNDVPSLRLDHMPYGGVKDSGLGREGVKYAILDMMESRILVKDS